MKIGEAARRTGTTIKAIRHYEALGLLQTLGRAGRYRELSANDIERIRLIARCRELGFGLAEIREVVQFVADAAPNCPEPGAMMEIVERRLRAIRDEIPPGASRGAPRRHKSLPATSPGIPAVLTLLSGETRS